MAHPKRRHSNTRSKIRRSHDFITVKSSTRCRQCGRVLLPHRVCSTCGSYRGKKVLTIKVKEDKKKSDKD